MPRLRFLSGAIVAALAFSSGAHATQFDKVVVFGDSLSDNGNISLAGGAQTPSRFTTNPGEVVVEHVADHYGITLQPSLLGGTDYAWGGAGVNTNSPGTPAGVPTITQQIGGYLAAGAADPNALYTVWGGANDIFYHAAVAGMGGETPTQAQMGVAAAGQQEVSLLAQLQAAGAKNIVVFNLPDIGSTPAAGAQEAIAPGSAQALSSLSLVYNGQLNTGLARLDTGIIPVNAYAFLKEVMANPSLYGFSNVTDAACGINSTAVQCGPAGSGAPYTYPAGADQTYLFADGVHPSTAADAILGQAVVSELVAPGQISMLSEAPLATAQAQTRVLHDQMHADTAGDGSRVFVAAGYARQRFDATGGSPRTDGHNAHLTIGVDGRAGDNVSMGVALGLSHGSADTAGNHGGYDLDTAMASGYAMYHRGGGYVGAYGGFGQVRYTHIERRFALGPAVRTESGEADGSQILAGLTGGFMFGGDDLRSGPFANLEWQRVRINGYQENSGDSTAMWFERQQRLALVGSLGWRVTGNWKLNDSVLQPYLDVAWNHDSHAGQDMVTAGLTTMNGSFRMGGYTPDSSWASAEIGLQAHYGHVTGWFGYNGRFADSNQKLNALNIGVNIAL